MPDPAKQSTVAKVVGTVTAIAAATLAQRILSAGWQATQGHKPPVAEDPEAGITFTEVLVAAALTGAVVAMARVLAGRGATRVAARIEAGRAA
ncbi:MAG: DUF4235 domain-containing protein [Cellulomonas sp.]|nr:DUF4235 domain-containing protein [Cellulomonas sp.]